MLSMLVPPFYHWLLLHVLLVRLQVAWQLMFLKHVLLGIEPGQGAKGRSPFQPGSPGAPVLLGPLWHILLLEHHFRLRWSLLQLLPLRLLLLPFGHTPPLLHRFLLSRLQLLSRLRLLQVPASTLVS